MHLPKKICLSCRHFSLQAPASGVCKLVKGMTNYPVKSIEESCESWKDCGQHYFIRTGWIKRQLASATGETTRTETGIIQ
jgi:hypothetical protein